MSLRILESIRKYSSFFSTLVPFSIIRNLLSKVCSSSRSRSNSSYITDKMTSGLISTSLYLYIYILTHLLYFDNGFLQRNRKHYQERTKRERQNFQRARTRRCFPFQVHGNEN
ncbi:hypothetical protein PBCV1_a303L [Paramecium bursaria Chlorella virus 1]|uniref:Uncharacterized protein n=1 Tax=Paramecium bursaria Chlorella virus 1 TaxID=10506 RepID=Q84619_PBCV1|nr:hypothetical protein PBCV1_a303L [Paramecium bursaria Chlorella virus 1]AAC96671.1 hypothetical protein [Paramecium bursaria Chlorella virus 1]